MADEPDAKTEQVPPPVPDHHLRTSLSEADAAGLLEIVKAKHARDASIFTEREPYFWEALISNTNRDSYFTRMMPSTLKNFAADAEAGVSFQNSHNTFEQPLGRSIAGKYTGPGGNGLARVTATFYTLRGLKLNSLAVDEFIDGVRSGVISDVSVGFYGGEYRCTICNRDMRSDWDCWHWPGMEYELEDKEGKPTGERKVAEAKIENARLAEVSAVYDGACPGAFITKAEREISAGRMKPETARFLTAQYRMRLTGSSPVQLLPSVVCTPSGTATMGGSGVIFSGVLPEAFLHTDTVRATVDARTQREETSMPDKEGQGVPPPMDTPTDPGILQSFHRSIAAALAEVPLPPESRADEPATLIRRLGAELIELRPLRDQVEGLKTKVAELSPQAEDGAAYRTAKVAETWGEYNRAGLSEGVNEEDQKGLWQRAPLTQVLKELESYKKLGDARFGGGRTSVDQGDPPGNDPQPAVPLHLYAA